MWAKDPKIGYKLINARDDTIFEKPMWRNVILRKRCLIPAVGFYEWKTYSIITTGPNKEMAQVHNRMPVILHQDDESSWLSPAHNNDRGAIEALLRPYEDNGLDF